ncbi:MAG: MaoC family dehydratase [Ilumatobacter sp.]|nr:MAG: MaoC family dehydratase [Ilumatobacter sp.]
MQERQPVTVLDGTAEVLAAVGRHLGHSDWIVVTQEQVDLFADATGDHQWIHVDVERAAAGPFGGPIAHGYLTLALSNLFLPQILEVRGFSMGVNVGVDRVRFPQPVPVGSRVRGGAELLEAVDLPDGRGLSTLVRITIEIDGALEPACVIESLTRWIP